jgi:hypothetical protein
VSKVAAASTIAKTNATRPQNRTKSPTIFLTLAGRPTLSLLRPDLLLLLDHGLGCPGHEIMPFGQPQPGLRHMRERDPRIAVSERSGHLEALLCTPPILV